LKRAILATAAAAGALMFGGGIAHADDPAPPPVPAPASSLSPEVAQALNKAYADYGTWPCGLSLGSVNGFPLPSLRYKQCDPAPQPAPAPLPAPAN
jgi:hypothetical protein